MGRTGYSDTENINGITESHLHIGLELVFDESQKESDNEIWVDMYALISTLEQPETVKQKSLKESFLLKKLVDNAKNSEKQLYLRCFH